MRCTVNNGGRDLFVLRLACMLLAGLGAGLSCGHAGDRYVWKAAPSSAPPYESWASAATNLWDAVRAAQDGETVWVTNGSHAVTNVIAVTKAVSLRSVNGRTLTTVWRSGSVECRLFVLSNALAVIDGFAITNGYGRALTVGGHSYGGAIRIYSGTVRNCRLSRNTCRGGAQGESPHGVNSFGGAIYMTTGRVENCEVANNACVGSGGSANAYGGAIEAVNGTIENCTITDNYAFGTGNGEGRGGGVRVLGAGRLLSSLVGSNRVSAANNVAPSYGGGVYMTGNGVVSNCTLVRNRCVFWENLGAGVYMTTGLVTHCTIVSNRSETGHSYAESQYAAGAGVWLSGGTVRNCVIAQNRSIHTAQIREGATRGAGILMTGGRVEHCTVARNVVDRYGRGAGIYMTGGQVWNTIVYHNYDDAAVAYTADHENLYQAGGAVNYSCVTNTYSAVTGTGNVCGDPGFAYKATNDYRLLPGSSCIDRGTNLPAVMSDRSGASRPQDGNGDALARSDIGAYEAVPPGTGAFRAGFTASPDTVVASSADVVFRAFVAGAVTNGAVYRWDFTNDGSFERSGSGWAVVTNQYASPSNHHVRLVVTNSVGTIVTVIRPAVYHFPAAVYASPMGSHVFPYDTLDKAATNLQAAFDAAAPGTTVKLTNGVFQVSTPLSLRRGITVTSVKGPTWTAIERKTGANTRIMLVQHPSAVVEQLTIRNGLFSNSGMAYGGGIWLTAGTVRNCMVTNNTASGQPNQPGYGGGIYMTGGNVRNCLLYRNTSQAGNNVGHGGGIYMAAGLVESCTVVSNYAQRTDASGATDGTRGGGIRLAGGSITNTIIIHNGIRVVTPVGVQLSVATATTNAGYCCSPDLQHDPGGRGNITNVPAFVDITRADYRQVNSSACVDAGKNLAWMTGGTDLAGKRRRSPRRVDIGAYEYQWPLPTMLILR